MTEIYNHPVLLTAERLVAWFIAFSAQKVYHARENMKSVDNVYFI